MISVFLLDNVDSFSYNLVDELRALELDVRIFRNTVPADHIVVQMEQQASLDTQQTKLLLRKVQRE